MGPFDCAGDRGWVTLAFVRRSSAIAAILATLVFPIAVEANSQTDSHASSPAGAVYEIPLQTARGDAAPKHPASTQHTGQQSPGGGGGFGGSAGSGGSGGSGGSAGSGGSGGSAGSSAAGSGNEPGVLPAGIKTENGFGSSSKVPGLVTGGGAGTSAGAGGGGSSGSSIARLNARPVAVPATPSAAASYALIVLIVLGGAGVGVAAATAIRRTLRSAP